MIVDNLLTSVVEFDGSGGRDDEADILDFGEEPVRKGSHPRPLYAIAVITETFTSGEADNTLQMSINSCDTEGGTYEPSIQLPAIPKAKLVEGVRLVLPLPVMGLDDDDDIIPGLQRFVRVQFAQGGTAADWTAGEMLVTINGG